MGQQYLSADDLNTGNYDGKYWQLGYYYIDTNYFNLPKYRVYVLYKIGDTCKQRKLFEYDTLRMLIKNGLIDVLNLHINNSGRLTSMKVMPLGAETRFNIVEPLKNGKYTVLGSLSLIDYKYRYLLMKEDCLIVRNNSNGRITYHNLVECSLAMGDSFTNARLVKAKDFMLRIFNGKDFYKIKQSGQLKILPNSDDHYIDQDILREMQVYIDSYNKLVDKHINMCSEILNNNGLIICDRYIEKIGEMSIMMHKDHKLDLDLTNENYVLRREYIILQQLYCIKHLQLVQEIDILKLSRYKIYVSSGVVFKDVEYHRIYSDNDVENAIRKSTTLELDKLEKILDNACDRQSILDKLKYEYDYDDGKDFSEEYNDQLEKAKCLCDYGISLIIRGYKFTETRCKYLLHNQVSVYLNNRELCEKIIKDSLAECIENLMNRKIFRSTLKLYGLNLITFSNVKVSDIVQAYKIYNNISNLKEENNTLAYFASEYCGFCLIEDFRDMINDEEDCLRHILNNLVGRYH